jgi:acetyl esterase/lipase
VSGAILMSGFYLAQAPLPPGHRAYFGDAADLYAARSPLNMARKLAHPVLVTIAESDPALLRGHSQDLAAALAAAGGTLTMSELPQHNHVSPLMSLGSDNDETGMLLRRFVADTTAARPAGPP